MIEDNKNHRSRLRQKMMENGMDSFLDYEVVELLLQFVYPRKDTKIKAKKLMTHFHDDIHALFHADAAELALAGLPETGVALFMSVRQAFIYQQRKKIKGIDYISSSQQVYDFFKYYFKGQKNEEFFVLYLNTANCILKAESLFEGSKNESRVYIRIIVEKCLAYHATQIIVVHNHPTGNLKASDSDIHITTKIQQALALLEIKLLDHLIIGDNEFSSFK